MHKGAYMPTTKPRITVTVSHETKAVLDRLSEASGQPASKFISELLDEGCHAIFSQMIEALELAKNKKTEAWDVLNSALSKAQYQGAQLSMAIHEQKRKITEEKGKKREKK
jgi:uncharacterized protein (DUF1778 family)